MMKKSVGNKKESMNRYIPTAVRYMIIKASRGQCYFPDCKESLIRQKSDGKYAVLGEFAHIEGYKGPRVNRLIEGPEKHTFENLMFLCRNHHKEIDIDETKYTINILKEYKKKHELKSTKKDNLIDLNKIKLQYYEDSFTLDRLFQYIEMHKDSKNTETRRGISNKIEGIANNLRSDESELNHFWDFILESLHYIQDNLEEPYFLKIFLSLLDKLSKENKLKLIDSFKESLNAIVENDKSESVCNLYWELYPIEIQSYQRILDNCENYSANMLKKFFDLTWQKTTSELDFEIEKAIWKTMDRVESSPEKRDELIKSLMNIQDMLFGRITVKKRLSELKPEEDN